jgi:hypothetical protein
MNIDRRNGNNRWCAGPLWRWAELDRSVKQLWRQEMVAVGAGRLVPGLITPDGK